jgi:hypothetical protein
MVPCPAVGQHAGLYARAAAGLRAGRRRALRRRGPPRGGAPMRGGGMTSFACPPSVDLIRDSPRRARCGHDLSTPGEGGGACARGARRGAATRGPSCDFLHLVLIYVENFHRDTKRPCKITLRPRRRGAWRTPSESEPHRRPSRDHAKDCGREVSAAVSAPEIVNASICL